MINRILIAVSIAGLAPAAAFAADAPAAAEPAAAAEATAPAATAFTDEQVRQYLKAAFDVNAINADANVAAADKPAKMIEAVKAAGLEPATFNAIAEASKTDAALQQQLQTQMASVEQPAQHN